MKRWIMHVDMDAFFASVEQRDNPELRGKPVIVGGDSRRGVVATASYEARKYGVHSAMPSLKAHELCPEGIFVRPRFDAYKKASDEIHQIMLHYADAYEPISLDEAFLDISGMGEKYKTLGAIGRAIKKSMTRSTSSPLSGLRPTSFSPRWQATWISRTAFSLSLTERKRKSLPRFPSAVYGASGR